ncbi:MAG TPA: MFS transporter [Pirellulales bacterium]|nr:MFS transporter [Pirellulales bacterium]
MADRDGSDAPSAPVRAETVAGDGGAKPTNVRMLVLALSCGVSFVLYLHRYVWGFVKKDVQDEFGWNAETLGWLDGLFPASYGVSQIPIGMFCDWFGSHLLLGAMILAWSLALAGTAWANTPVSMAGVRLTFGLAQSGCYPALAKVSKNWFPVDVRSTAQGLIATFFGRGGGAMSFVLFGTVLVGWLEIPWRRAVGVFTLVGLAAGASFLLLFRNTPREHPWANAAEAELIAAGDPHAAYATRSRVRWAALLGSRTILFLFARSFASNMADVLFVYWVPLYLRTEKEAGISSAGWMAALPLVGGAFGGVASGMIQSHLIRSLGWRRWARATVGMTGKLLAAATIVSCAFPHDAMTVVCTFMAVKFFADCDQPAEWGALSDVAGRNAATVFACVNTVGSLGGFVAGPLMGSLLLSFSGSNQPTAAGWNALFLVTALEYVTAAACWPFIDCGRPLDLSSSPGPSSPPSSGPRRRPDRRAP